MELDRLTDREFGVLKDLYGLPFLTNKDGEEYRLGRQLEPEKHNAGLKLEKKNYIVLTHYRYGVFAAVITESGIKMYEKEVELRNSTF